MKDEAKNQPIPTDTNPYDSLKEDDQLAVDMAVQNYPYIDIANKFKVQRPTVKDWFCKSGRLYEAYRYAIREHRKEYKKKFKTIDDQIQDGAVEAVINLRQMAKRKSMPGVVAAKDILDRAGFKPPDKVEVEDKRPSKVNINVTVLPANEK